MSTGIFCDACKAIIPQTDDTLSVGDGFEALDFCHWGCLSVFALAKAAEQ